MPRLPILAGEPAPVLPFRVLKGRQAAQLPATGKIAPEVVSVAMKLQELIKAGGPGVAAVAHGMELMAEVVQLGDPHFVEAVNLMYVSKVAELRASGGRR